jgi:hypothetical protein
MRPAHVQQVRPRKDHRGVDLLSHALPFGHLWYAEPNAVSNDIGYAKFYSRSHQVVTRVYDEAGNVIEVVSVSRNGVRYVNRKTVYLFRSSSDC